MLGHAEEWFYRGLAGIAIDLSRPQNERIRIQPAPVGDIRTASASFTSIFGLIKSQWSRDGNSLHMNITVPPGATATVLFPPAYGSIRLDGQSLTLGNGIHSVGREGQAIQCVIGSGTYHFQATSDVVS